MSPTERRTMSDTLLPLPTAPEGVDPVHHVRQRLMAAAEEASHVTKRLHLESAPACLCDRAADASTHLRALRNAARQLVEQECDDEMELLGMFAALHAAIEDGDDVLMSCGLRIAFEHDIACWDQVQDRALAIGELAGGGFMGFVFNELRDHERLTVVERRADVPLMHALMRSLVAGVLRGRANPVTSADVGYRIDELLMKMIKAHGRIAPDDPMMHLRLATTAAGALWNFTRIALRDDMTGSGRSEYERARRDALRSIRADVRYQQRHLPVLPDFDHAYDVGVALATVDPILRDQAALHGVDFPRRADAVAWAGLFYNVLPEP